MRYKILDGNISNSFSTYGDVEYEYDSKECNRSYCGCRDGTDYCRGSTYQGLRVESVDLDSVRKHFLQEIKKTTLPPSDPKFMDYCVDRLLRLNKVYNTEDWEINTCSGYYGQEISDAKLDDNLFGDILEKTKHLISLAPDERIRYVLQEEYQFLLPQLLKCKFKETEIDIKDIFIPNREYHKKIQKGDLVYKNFSLPIGIYSLESENIDLHKAHYRLVDGYHRYCSYMSQETKPSKVNVIVAT